MLPARMGSCVRAVKEASEMSKHGGKAGFGVQKCIADAHRTVVRFSDEWLALLGYDREELAEELNNEFASRIVSEDLQKILTSVRESKEAQSEYAVEYRVRTKGEKEIPVCERGFVSTQEGVDYCYFSISPVGWAQAYGLETVLEGIDNPLFIIDENQKIVYANKGFRRWRWSGWDMRTLSASPALCCA